MSSRPQNNQIIDRIPPQSLEAEQAVLGAMLLEAEAREKAVASLRPSSFYRYAHEIIFQAISILHTSGQEVDLLMAQNQLQANQVLEMVGGIAYLTQCMNALPNAAYVDNYIRIVEEKASLRRMLGASAEIERLAWKAESGDTSLTDALLESEKVLSAVEENVSDSSRFSAGLVLGNCLPETRQIDPLWFGLYPACAHLLIGESGAGKSSLLYNIAIAAARNQTIWNLRFGVYEPLSVLYIDPENAGNYRNLNELDGGNCRRKINNILGEVGALPPTIAFHDGENLNLFDPADIRALKRMIRRGIDGNPFDIVILDPLAKVCRFEDENSNAEMQQAADTIRALSRDIGACVIATHHTGKTQVDGVLSGRGGSGLAGPFDVVFTYRSTAPADINDEWSGETQVRRDVCRLKIWKDRFGLHGNAALYLRLGSPRIDCFERCSWEEWKDAAKQVSDGTQSAKAVLAIRVALDDGEWHSRQTIHQSVKDSAAQIGRDSVDRALDSMVKQGEVEEARMGGATKIYRIKPATPAANDEMEEV